MFDPNRRHNAKEKKIVFLLKILEIEEQKKVLRRITYIHGLSLLTPMSLRRTFQTSAYKLSFHCLSNSMFLQRNAFS